jgi:acyl dehydratase
MLTGRYSEDFEEGMEFVTPARTVTEADVVNFACFSGDFHPLHTDAVYASESVFGERIAHGMCGFSIAMGLLIRLNLFEKTIVAFYGIDKWRFTSPIKLGTTIHVVAKVVNKEEKRPEHGIVGFNLDVVDQNGTTVMTGVIKTLMMKKNPAK